MQVEDITVENNNVQITGVLRNAQPKYLTTGGYVVGNIYGDVRGRFPDGSLIHTSFVVRQEGDLIFTLNSVYRVESWDIQFF